MKKKKKKELSEASETTKALNSNNIWEAKE